MDETVSPIMTSVHNHAHHIRVIVVGAGGTGGRLIPPLMQVLRRGDSVAIVDGDHVEDRNLARQNFRSRDIGLNKAEVLANRYRRDGINVDAYAAFITDENSAEIISGAPTNMPPTAALSKIILGCVDNPEARGVIKRINKHDGGQSIWIDGGNERRGGQVIMSACLWPFKVRALRDRLNNEVTRTWNLDGMSAMPQLLQLQAWHCDRCNIKNKAGAKLCSKCKQPEASCQDRIDLQTVAVNQLSASCMLNMLSCVLYGVPMMACGTFFSTLNTMSPIKLKEVVWDKSEIKPERVYAEEV